MLTLCATTTPFSFVLQTDYDECLVANVSGCSHGCNNTEGSYSCTCPTGFAMSTDGRSCEGVYRTHVALSQAVSENAKSLEMRLSTHGTRTHSFTQVLQPPHMHLLHALMHATQSLGPLHTMHLVDCSFHSCMLLLLTTDVNECDGSHGCKHRCINEYGSFKCACLQEGYRLATDGTSCNG